MSDMTTEPLLAFHNDRAVKAKYLRRVRAHAKADRLIQGTGWSNGKGCAIGCTLEAYEHERYPKELGVPVELAYLEDRIFERLTRAEAQKWPAAVLSAIPVGADLSLVWPRFQSWVLRTLPPASLKRTDVRSAVEAVANLFDEWTDAGAKPARKRWTDARSAADAAADAAAADAAAYAAYAAYAAATDAYAAAYAAYAAAAAAAYAAAYAATAAAAAAAYAAAYAAYAAAAAATAYAADARSKARRDFWTGASKKLLSLLREAPVRSEPTPAGLRDGEGR